jgi:hypothetical protein
MADIPCACPSKECEAKPHKGRKQCSSTIDDADVATESDSDSGERSGPLRCEPCVKTTPMGAQMRGGMDGGG